MKSLVASPLLETLNRRKPIEALYGLIEPALMAAVVKGAQALRVCQSGNIVRPEPVGEVSMFAQLISYDHNTLAPPDLARRALPMTPRFPDGDPPMRPTPTCTSVATVRETLRFLMYRHHGGYRLRSASRNPPDSLVPTLTDAERSRLLSLVEALEQDDPDRDLPLLLCKDTGGSLHTSWPSRSGQMWTRVDRENERPGYLLLSPPGVIDGTCLKEEIGNR